MADLLVLRRPETNLRQKNLNLLHLPKRKGWHQCHKESRWQVRQSRLWQKEKIHLPKSPDCEVRKSQGERERRESEKGNGVERMHTTINEDIKARAWGEKMHFTIKEGRLQVEGGKAKRTFLSSKRHERVSGRKNPFRMICRGLFSLQIWPNLYRKDWGTKDSLVR